MKGYTVHIDEKTGEVKIAKISDQEEQKNELIDQYFFHSTKWSEIKKKNLSNTIQNSQSVSNEKSKTMPWKMLNRIIDDNRLPKLQKIKTKQKREGHVDRSLIMVQPISSLEHAKPLTQDKNLASISDRNLEEIEKRLGLKRVDQVEQIRQMLDQRETKCNIQLLKEKVILQQQQKAQQTISGQDNVEVKAFSEPTNKQSSNGGFVSYYSVPHNKNYILKKPPEYNGNPKNDKSKSHTPEKTQSPTFKQKRLSQQDHPSMTLDKPLVLKQIKDPMASTRYSQGFIQTKRDQIIQLQTINPSVDSEIITSPFEKYQNSEMNQTFCQNARRPIFSQSVPRRQLTLSSRHQSQFQSLSKCHGNKVQITSPRQKLVERLFESPNQTFLSKIGQIDESTIQGNQYLQRKEQIKNLLLDILDNQDKLQENQSIKVEDRSLLMSPGATTIESGSFQNTPNFLNMIIQNYTNGVPTFVDDMQYKQIERMFDQYYNYKEPDMESPKKGKKYMKQQESEKSFLDSEFNEEEILKEVSENFMKAKFSFLVKSLNIILLKKSDPFVAQMYKNYLRVKRKGKEEEQQKNFYQRMQDDISKRKTDSLDISQFDKRKMGRLNTNFSGQFSVNSKGGHSSGGGTRKNASRITAAFPKRRETGDIPTLDDVPEEIIEEYELTFHSPGKQSMYREKLRERVDESIRVSEASGSGSQTFGGIGPKNMKISSKSNVNAMTIQQNLVNGILRRDGGGGTLNSKILSQPITISVNQIDE